MCYWTRMRALILTVVILSSAASWSQSRCASEPILMTPRLLRGKELVNDLVDRYQTAVAAKFGTPVKLSFHFNRCDAFQMYAWITPGGEAALDVHSGAIMNFTEEALLAATCHELGHFLGRITRGHVGEKDERKQNLAVEGEADYFAGGCAKRYYDDPKVARRSVYSLFGALYQTLDMEQGEREIYRRGNGISSGYPSGPCRLLSAVAGIEGKPRPRCWYNPI